MEEVKDMSKSTRRSRRIKFIKDKGTDFSLRILAFIIAVISWFIMSITQFPTINKTIAGVHVDFNMSGTAAEERGLAALNYKDITVDVEISGMNYEIGTYTENDLIATVDLNDVTKEGTYRLDIEVRSSHTTDRCTIVSVTPDSIEVDFDRITQKTIEISAEAPMITAEEGYTLREPTVTPSEITIEGPKNELDNISRVAAKVSGSKRLMEDTTLSTEDIVFYDADDNKLDSSKFSIKSGNSYDVNFVVYKKKTLNLSVNILDAPDDFDISSLPMTLSQESLSVITPHLDEVDEEDIIIGSISLKEINLSRPFTFEVPLETGEINMSGNNSVSVTFDDKGYTSATFTLHAENIELQNAPPAFESTVDTNMVTEVTIYGPEDIVSKLTDDDIYATVSLSDVKGTGSYTKEARIYAKGYNNVWCFGNNEIQVTASVPKADTDSSSGD